MHSVRNITNRLSIKQWIAASALLLLAIGFLLYGHTLWYEFVELDDPLLILENAAVQSVSWAHLKTIFTTYDPELYIPLTFLSYQIDIALGGLHPFLIHVHNLLEHILNAGLFGLLCYQLIRNRTTSLFAALLFLVHPLHVEAVVWATGRKDLLSTTFFLLSLIVYIEFIRRADRRLYVGSLLMFLLGLLAKVTVISLPIILILIDWLEERRMTLRTLLQKLPFFVLSLLFGIIALFGKSDAPDLPVITRILVAAKSFMFSIGKLFVPMGLSPMYAYSGEISLRNPDILLSLILVIALVVVTFLMRRRWKIFAFSVAFTMVTFFPSFGNLIKNGDYYLTSDRYSYIPSMGIFLIVIFALANRMNREKIQAKNPMIYDSYFMIPTAMVILLIFLGSLAYRQSVVWSDSETLSRYVTQVTPNARLGHLWYGNALREAGKIDEALAEYGIALSFKDDAQVYYDRALAFEATGDISKATADYEQALIVRPNYPLAHINLGRLLYQQGKKEEARRHFETAAEQSPNLAMPLYNLGVLEGEQKHFEAAVELYRKALVRDPDLSDARANLAIALLELGKTAEAVEQLKETLRRDPENATARGVLQTLIEKGVVRGA